MQKDRMNSLTLSLYKTLCVVIVKVLKCSADIKEWCVVIVIE